MPSMQSPVTSQSSTALFSTTIISTPTSTTHLSAPSEVSQNTAISDRPKVKPVSKKDGKNLRKAAPLLQPNQMVSICNNMVSETVNKFFLALLWSRVRVFVSFSLFSFAVFRLACDTKIGTKFSSVATIVTQL